ncbi:hypothetical protein, partial [Acidithiobacillus sp.]|uniref:hypothetical protein n=1 Tax=Acidithiobacillus sp. TaxID=1872118 RepID=UPI0025BEE750
EVDTFGVLLAAALTARDCPVSKVRGLLDMAVPKIMDQIQEAREASRESDLILETLLSLRIEVQRHECDDRGNERINRETMGIGRVIQAAVGRPGGDDARTLADFGLVVREKDDGKTYLAIASRHASLAKLFQSTRWRVDGAWTGGLREIEGAIRNQKVRFGKDERKGTLIPLSALNIEVDAPRGGDGSVIAFPTPKKGFGADLINAEPFDPDVPF